MRILFAALIFGLLHGCAVVRYCDDHPVVCATGVAVVGGAAAYALTHRDPVSKPAPTASRLVPCNTGPCIY
jgi:hypothetical protein